MEEINVYTFAHKVVKDCKMDFDGIYEEGDELTSEERDWIESDDGILAVFQTLPNLRFSDTFPYEYVGEKTYVGRKGYETNVYVIKRKRDNKHFKYDVYGDDINNYDLIETHQIVTKVWEFEKTGEFENRD